MKLLTNFKFTVETAASVNKINIAADIVDRPMPKRPAQQVTLNHFSSHDPHFVRHVQLLGHGYESALCVRRFQHGVAIDLENWITAVALFLEPKLAAPPKGKVVKSPNILKAEILTELHPTFQWQMAESANTPNESWKPIEGQISDTLNVTPDMKSKFVRCFANTDAGPVATPPIPV